MPFIFKKFSSPSEREISSKRISSSALINVSSEEEACVVYVKNGSEIQFFCGGISIDKEEVAVRQEVVVETS